MRLHVPFVTTLLCATSAFLALSGCKPKGEGGGSGQSASIPMATRVLGVWSSACEPVGAGASRYVELTVSRDELLYFQFEYADADCQTPRGRVSVNTPYLPLAADEGEQKIALVTQPRSAVVKPGSQQEYDRLQSQKLCGSAQWGKGSEKNVSMTHCGDVFLDAAKAGTVETLGFLPSGELVLGSSGLKFKRKPANKAQGQALQLYAARKKPTLFLYDAHLPRPEAAPPAGEVVLGFAPESFQVQACSDNPNEACGEFTENMRKACAYCGGGIDTCQKAKRWALNFTKAIVTQLQSRPPGGVCKPPEGEIGVRDPMESHDELRTYAENEVADVNNQMLAGGIPEPPPAQGGGIPELPPADGGSAPAAPQAQPGASQTQPGAAPQSQGGLSPEEERLKHRKEQVAQAAGIGVGFTTNIVKWSTVVAATGVCGPLCGLAVFGGGMAAGSAVSWGVTKATGMLLDTLMPTPRADAVFQQRREQENQQQQQGL